MVERRCPGDFTRALHLTVDLTPRERQAVMGQYVFGLRSSELGGQFELSANTVRQNTMRGLRKLRSDPNLAA